ncbi:unnamed protein product [Malassezia sympodialis ATCC 42132]|uniref:Dolichol-phosphate mannosyltransferase subunit 3 n=1 Tax=Malassezia sympodialis (strain ATCC 42132) TaxID=1230383 RepID=M5ENC1_MALS4|nr:uncharacterized protein MSY001_1865 [Malassezia sympodialis ATCC 42132]CCU99159.1 unnamed protein product [Malassezia sympodialis ATCC 42132]SHO78404.1 Hypothetical protein MSYG_2747 [Malassezia sympodialis ATCC 42132]|eukprot:XP_018740424.1 uncharacterized protein MSY001_1865 [Malassezia sympodialis ATCC 42132]
MTRATRFAMLAGCAALLYLIFLVGIVPVPLVPASVADAVLPTLPWWVLVSTGAYLLFQVGWGLYNFNDTPQAYDELLLDIKTAKDYLRERGVSVDA